MPTEINEKVFSKFPEMESGRLIIRQFHETDADRLYEIRSNNEVMRYMDTFPERNINEIKYKIQEMNLAFELKQGLNWALEEKSSGMMIGYFGIWRIERENCRGEIGYSLDPKYWGKGYMAEAFQKIIPFGFQQLHIHSFEGNVNPNNENSIKILKKHGFVKEGYFRENFLFDGKFLDSEVYSLLEKDWDNL